MWALAGSLLTWLLGFFIKPKVSDVQAASQTGEKLGQAEQQSADGRAQEGTVKAANEAKQEVRDQLARNPGSLREDDGYRRD